MEGLGRILATALAVFGVKVLAARARARQQASAQDAVPDPSPPVQPPPAPSLGVWPVPGARAPTAARLQFGYQRSDTHRHQGIDIAAPEGTPVVAPWAGEVVHVNHVQAVGFRGYGKTVVLRVDVGGMRMWLLFAHLQSVHVGVGEDVAAGTVIGTVGRTEFGKDDPNGLMSSGPHLHFELSPRPYPQDSETPRLDPAPFFEGLTARAFDPRRFA